MSAHGSSENDKHSSTKSVAMSKSSPALAAGSIPDDHSDSDIKSVSSKVLPSAPDAPPALENLSLDPIPHHPLLQEESKDFESSSTVDLPYEPPKQFAANAINIASKRIEDSWARIKSIYDRKESSTFPSEDGRKTRSDSIASYATAIESRKHSTVAAKTNSRSLLIFPPPPSDGIEEDGAAVKGESSIAEEDQEK